MISKITNRHVILLSEIISGKLLTRLYLLTGVTGSTHLGNTRQGTFKIHNGAKRCNEV